MDKTDYGFFMDKALEEARNALRRGEFPVGCVMVRDGRILVDGARRRSHAEQRNELDHAEMVALRRLVDLGNGAERSGVIVFSTLEPCLMCYAALLINGIHHIVYAYEDILGGGTNVDLGDLNPFYRDMAVTVVPHVRRQESLALFRTFFASSDNDYMRDSLLARHALGQQ